MVRCLSGYDAQAFIDTIDEASLYTLLHRKSRFPLKLPHPVGQVLDIVPSDICGRYLQTAYNLCGRQALLPRSLLIPLCYDPTRDPVCRGQFADMWEGRHNGKNVAAKALRICRRSDLGQIRKVSWWRSQLDTSINEPTMSRTEVLQGGCGMECSLPSKCAASIRRDDDRGSIRDGIGVDGKR